MVSIILPLWRRREIGVAAVQVSLCADTGRVCRIVPRARIRDDDLHVASKTQTVEVLPLAFEFGQRHRLVDAVVLKKAVKHRSRREAEHAA